MKDKCFKFWLILNSIDGSMASKDGRIETDEFSSKYNSLLAFEFKTLLEFLFFLL